MSLNCIINLTIQLIQETGEINYDFCLFMLFIWVFFRHRLYHFYYGLYHCLYFHYCCVIFRIYILIEYIIQSFYIHPFLYCPRNALAVIRCGLIRKKIKMKSPVNIREQCINQRISAIELFHPGRNRKSKAKVKLFNVKIVVSSVRGRNARKSELRIYHPVVFFHKWW